MDSGPHPVISSSGSYALLSRDQKKLLVERNAVGRTLEASKVSRTNDITSEQSVETANFPYSPAYLNLTSLFKSCEEQIGRKFNYCLLNAVSSSNFSSPEQAIMEIGRSSLLFVILIQALASEDLMVTSLVLNTANTLNLFDKKRSTPYLKDLLKAEFDLKPELCAKAYDYGMRINNSGLLEIPDITLDILKCFSQEIEDKTGEAGVEVMED